MAQQQITRSTKDTVDLPFRPFLRWLDRNIEELFVEAAREMKKNETTTDANEEEPNESCSEEEDSSEAIEMKKYGSKENECERGNKEPNKVKDHHRGRAGKKNQQRHKTTEDDTYASSERKELLLSDFLVFKKPSKNKDDKGAVSSKSSHGDRTQTEGSSKDHIVFVDQDLSLEKENEIIGKAQSIDMNGDGEVGNTKFENFEGYQIEDMPKGVPLKEEQDDGNQHRGTEIRFKGLELSENTSTLTTDSVALMMECLKCKTKIDIKVEKTRLVGPKVIAYQLITMFSQGMLFVGYDWRGSPSQVLWLSLGKHLLPKFSLI